MNPGDTLGSYRILAAIGSGAFGHVYKAEHIVTRRIEALKIVSSPAGASSETRQRFLREIEVHARLSHPNIAAVHNAFFEGERVVMAMELVEGSPLSALLAAGPMAFETGINYVRQLLGALAYAHGHGVVHRDVKPANILITPQGVAKLADFGVARAPEDIRLTQAGATVGSIAYMSPEQVRGLPSVDPRSDLYSAGAILYEIAAGRLPFTGDNAYSLMQAQVDTAPEPPSRFRPGISPALDRLILRALEKAPQARFQTAEAFTAALVRAMQPTGPPIAANAPSRARTMFRTLPAALGLVMFGAFGIAAVDTVLSLKQQPASIDLRFPAPSAPTLIANVAERPSPSEAAPKPAQTMPATRFQSMAVAIPEQVPAMTPAAAARMEMLARAPVARPKISDPAPAPVDRTPEPEQEAAAAEPESTGASADEPGRKRRNPFRALGRFIPGKKKAGEKQ